MVPEWQITTNRSIMWKKKNKILEKESKNSTEKSGLIRPFDLNKFVDF